ncbi:U4/U6 small nuclear ribonucleoprotein Prp [Parasponia andersonii]|uniref:U4/U6 small nuclear ribonucleoprotein Prp n=1 Tax=Parasponia andersonii TaxID=3476 RepID=A0A2P5DPZ3_PARAD|nr:U4/U6 small nuclear ribonucleoprotein Prp [Parasponia andersonii]
MEKEKASSKRTREERDHRKHRTRDGDDETDHRRRRHHTRSDRDSKRDREGSRERSFEPRSEKEESRDRSKHRRELTGERSEEREEESVERRHKRKERGASEDRDGDGGGGGEKRAKKERRKFEDRVEEDGQEENGSLRRFEDRRVKEEGDGGDEYGTRIKKEEEVGGGDDDEGLDNSWTGKENGGGSLGNGAALDPLAMASGTLPETSLTPSHPLPTKVSSISTTHENKGVSITRSHEVPGKSSTDGTSSTAGKSGSLSLDVLAKAKKALQIQKELSEKLKKLPLLNKGATTSSDASANLGPKEGAKLGTISSATPGTAVSGTTLSSSSLPAAGAASVNPSASGMATSAGLTAVPNYEAVKRAQELAARMGFRQDPEFAPLINLFPGQSTPDVIIPQKPTKAPVLRLDALGREIDEHGNVVNLTKPSNLSTLKVNINKQKKDSFQILKPDLDVDPESNPHFDSSMGVNKTKLLRPKRMSFQFVEEGKWSKDAEHIKLKSKFGEAQAKEHKAKQAQLAKAKAAPDINPNLIEVSERVITKEKPKEPIPEVEWWDVPLLHSGLYGDIADGNMPEDTIKVEKITIYVEHPRPIDPPAEPAPPPPQPLKLTKKEQKKLRTQRRLGRERERQEMIRQGLIEPPKPKVKMSNLMKVLGSEATQDPTRLEKEIRSAAAEREQAHIDRNTARKLTPAERREKKERKLFDDPNTVETMVSVYKINDLSHPQTRFKVDIFARQNRLTGCAVISDGISVVVVEGGSKSIKRYGKLMLRRINWANAVKEEEEDEDEQDDKSPNKCVLVWQGSVAKPAFTKFSIHDCMTEAAARKIYADGGVVHYWDLSVNFTEEI